MTGRNPRFLAAAGSRWRYTPTKSAFAIWSAV